MARDAYAYLYLPMIAGIILFSIGSEEILHQDHRPGRRVRRTAHGPAVPMLFGGLICYFAVNMLFQLRTLHTAHLDPRRRDRGCWRWPSRSRNACRRWARSPSPQRSASAWWPSR